MRERKKEEVGKSRLKKEKQITGGSCKIRR